MVLKLGSCVFKTEAPGSLYCSTLRPPWVAKIPILKLVRITMLVKLLQVFLWWFITTACCLSVLIPQVMRNSSGELLVLSKSFKCHTFSHLSFMVLIHTHLNPVSYFLHESWKVCVLCDIVMDFLACDQEISSLTWKLFLKTVFKTISKLLLWMLRKLTDCLLVYKGGNPHSPHLECCCRPARSEQGFRIASNSGGLCCTLAQRDTLPQVS